MPLTLTIISYQRLSPGQETTKVVDRESIYIGRGPDNDWVLPDPERVVSSKHCAISYRDGHYYITDSSVNGVFVNQSEQRLGKGNTAELHDGDELILGDYEVQVSLAEESAAGEFEFQEDVDKTDVYDSPIADHFKQSTDLPEFPEHDPFSGLPPADKARAAESKRFPDDADVLGIDNAKPPPWWQHTEADHLPVEQEFFQPPEPVIPPLAADKSGLDDAPANPSSGPAASDQSIIPDDWDAGLDEPFPDELLEPDAPVGPSEPIPTARPAASEQLQEPLIPGIPDEAVEPSAADNDPFATEIIPEDALEPLADLPSDIPESGAAPPPISPQPPPLRDHGTRDELLSAQPSPPPSQSSHSAPQESAPQEQAALQAFLAGAGLTHLQIGAADAPQLMHEIGAIFRQTVQGLMDVLMSRNTIKSEFRLSQTMIRPVENNPLKFSPNVDDAMISLLTRRGPAFLPPIRAVQEGFDDIRVHQLAVMAGVQAALLNLLKRFDPQALETRLGENSVLDNIMPSKRKARYWELFTLLYNEIAKEAEDDFQELFGREFARAYEEQINQL